MRLPPGKKQLYEVVWRIREIRDPPKDYLKEPIKGPEHFAQRFGFLFNDLAQELMIVFCLNARNTVTTIDPITTGTLNASLVHPREVFRAAVHGLAAAIIVAHNHPSGNTEPSQEDIDITRQIVESGKILGIPVHDHVIFARNTFTSLAERGLL